MSEERRAWVVEGAPDAPEGDELLAAESLRLNASGEGVVYYDIPIDKTAGSP